MATLQKYYIILPLTSITIFKEFTDIQMRKRDCVRSLAANSTLDLNKKSSKERHLFVAALGGSNLSTPFQTSPVSFKNSSSRFALVADPGSVSVETFAIDSNKRKLTRSIRSHTGAIFSSSVALHKEISTRIRDQDELAALYDQAFLLLRSWPEIRRNHPPVRIVDLFCGCGLMSLGVAEACRAINRGIDISLAVDFDQVALSVFKQNFPNATTQLVRLESILDRSLQSGLSFLERSLRKRIPSVELTVGGPPCQGHSSLNNHTRGSDPKNRLYDRMGRFAQVVGPEHIIIENVSSVLSDKSRVVDRTIAVLLKLGYSVDHDIVETSSLGVPQARRRHILVASLSRAISLQDTLSRLQRPARSVGWAIEDLQKLARTSVFDTPSTPSARARKRMGFLFEKNRYDLPDRMRPKCHREKVHTYKSVYGRMYWDKPAQTITSGFNCMGQGRFIHPKEMRTITPHEAARLQFIPDFFEFPPTLSRSSLAEVIANAVPAKLTYSLALELLR